MILFLKAHVFPSKSVWFILFKESHIVYKYYYKWISVFYVWYLICVYVN